MKLKVFSLFTGIGGFELGMMQAFGKKHIEIVGYAEIDKFSCAVLAHRFPSVKNYGDVSLIDTDELPDFDILVGGSPCQDLSSCKQAGQGLKGEKSGLFMEYLRILQAKMPAFFVLENVASMKNVDRDIISELLGVQPIMINSALLTAQYRKRYYWTNIPGVGQPADTHISLADILQPKVDEKYFINRQSRKSKQIILTGNEETPICLKEYKSEAAHAERKKNKALFGVDNHKRNPETAYYAPSDTKKANCLTGGIHAVNMIVVQKEG